MNRLALALAGIAAAVSAPTLALEHTVVIEHDAGPIAADYRGTVTITTAQTGTVGAAGRPSTLACRWSAKLSVERAADLAQAVKSHRTLTRDNVAKGNRSGWCETNAKAIDKLVDGRREEFRRSMMALVEIDRAALLAEADSAAATPRG